MTTYRMDDGTIVKTDNAVHHWSEDTRWDGHNHISIATGSQWYHEDLYKSKKGRYWLEYWGQDGSAPSAEWLSREEAARWLLANDHDLPDDLDDLQDEIEE